MRELRTHFLTLSLKLISVLDEINVNLTILYEIHFKSGKSTLT